HHYGGYRNCLVREYPGRVLALNPIDRLIHHFYWQDIWACDGDCDDSGNLYWLHHCNGLGDYDLGWVDTDHSTDRIPHQYTLATVDPVLLYHCFSADGARRWPFDALGGLFLPTRNGRTDIGFGHHHRDTCLNALPGSL